MSEKAKVEEYLEVEELHEYMAKQSGQSEELCKLMIKSMQDYVIKAINLGAAEIKIDGLCVISISDKEMWLNNVVTKKKELKQCSVLNFRISKKIKDATKKFMKN